MPIKVVMADDHEVFRVGLRVWLEGEPIQVVAEAGTGNAAFKLVQAHKPDVAILDVRMPGGDGLACLARIKLDVPQTHVLMLSAFDNPTFMARALALGASGYLLKSASKKEIIGAVTAAAKGEDIWSHNQLQRVTGALTPSATVQVDVGLTKRESEVIKQLALGLTNKEIAKALGISYETVKEHVQHILYKLNVSDRTQAAVWAVRNNLV
jgi:DNA-binding NarL/FixJ family response regulator